MGFQNMTKERAEEIRKMGFEARMKNKLSEEDKKNKNVTIKFSNKVWEKFKEVCKKKNDKPARKINEWVKEYIEENDKK